MPVPYLTAVAFTNAIRVNYPDLVVPTKVPASYHARVGKALKESKFTLEEATLLGQWLRAQKWLTEPTTLLTVATKGGEWLAKAQASKAKIKKEVQATEWVNMDDLEV